MVTPMPQRVPKFPELDWPPAVEDAILVRRWGESVGFVRCSMASCLAVATRIEDCGMRLAIVCIVIGLIAVLVGSCSAALRIENCRTVCNQYQQCVDSDLDVVGCIKRCERRGAEDEGYSTAVQACGTCMKGRSCLGASTCVLECRRRDLPRT